MSDPRYQQGAGMGTPDMSAVENVDENRSLLNPTDGAMAMQQGKLKQDMTFGQLCEQNFGISWDEPLTTAIPKLQKQMQNRTAAGKMQNIAKGAQRPGRPAFVQPGQQAQTPGIESGLQDLMQRMK
ncbi:MAG: hypothetical protein PHQ35_11415 [Phycisphaerae bacterium]|nr:hypothetical protein [Phycisphaerae bacterium]